MKNMSSEISDRRIGEAAEAYLEREHMPVIDRGCGLIDFVCKEDDGTMVFVSVSAGDGIEDSDEDIDRKAVEAEMLSWCLSQEEGVATSTKLRFDTLHIMVAGDNKGILRHHRCALL